MSMIENHISGYLHNELFSESNEEKCMVFQRMAWLLIIKNCSNALQAFPSSLALCIFYFLFHKGKDLCIFYFLFHKGKDISAVIQPSIQHLVYVFPIFFHKCFNNFHLSKNILINIFFTKTYVSL